MKELDFIQTASFQRNIDKYGLNDNTCECCGKQLENLDWAVNTIEGPTVVEAHITEEQMEEAGVYPQGIFYLGSSCIKKYPKAFRKDMRKEK
tara:strand:- start:2874 stop:3149 length:276 start_codon:yes stop_codon:yes gene_type:complete